MIWQTERTRSRYTMKAKSKKKNQENICGWPKTRLGEPANTNILRIEGIKCAEAMSWQLWTNSGVHKSTQPQCTHTHNSTPLSSRSAELSAPASGALNVGGGWLWLRVFYVETGRFVGCAGLWMENCFGELLIWNLCPACECFLGCVYASAKCLDPHNLIYSN